MGYRGCGIWSANYTVRITGTCERTAQKSSETACVVTYAELKEGTPLLTDKARNRNQIPETMEGFTVSPQTVTHHIMLC